MKLKQYKTCVGCAAICQTGYWCESNGTTYHPNCSLAIDLGAFITNPREPQEPCYKPKTKKQVKEAELLTRQYHAQNAIDKVVCQPQKFKNGEVVWIGDMPEMQSHFDNNLFAIVEGTYATLCSSHDNSARGDFNSYSLFLLKDRPGSSSWYYESQLRKVTKKEIKQLVKDYRLPESCLK